MKKERPLAEGTWADGTPWRFIASSKEPNLALCTAVFGILIINEGLVVVKHKDRGWELPGGHIDEGEEMEEALFREVMEEAGVAVSKPKLVGYKQIFPKSPVPHRDKPGLYYPYPHSFIPYYFSNHSEIFDVELAPDVQDVKVVDLSQARNILATGHNHDLIVEYALKKFQNEKS